MVSKVKALIGQRDSIELESEEIKPSSDFLATKGISFESLDTHLIEKIGGIIKQTIPSHTCKPTYVNENISSLEVFNGFTQTTPNRIAKNDVSYTNDLVTSEALKIYDPADGTTVLRTITTAYTYVNDSVTNIQVSEI